MKFLFLFNATECTDTQEENCNKNKKSVFRLIPLFAWHLFLENINMNIVMAKEKKEDDNNKTIHTATYKIYWPINWN